MLTSSASSVHPPPKHDSEEFSSDDDGTCSFAAVAALAARLVDHVRTTTDRSRDPTFQRALCTVSTHFPAKLSPPLELSRSLQAQYASTQNTIQLLELRITKLQQLVQATQTKVDDQHEAHQAAIKEAIESVCVPEQERELERETLTEMINEWKKGVEGSGHPFKRSGAWRRTVCVALEGRRLIRS